MKILLIIPAYNEAENILNTVKKIEDYSKEIDYIVINDGSTDNTLEVLENNNLNHINLIQNLGIGGAVQTGYKYAYYNDYDIAVQFDGDGQHDINFLNNICEPIIQGQANLCVGSRYLEKETSKFQSTFMRRLGKNVISNIIRIFCGQRITDPTSGFRAADKKVIEIFAMNYPSDYPEPESLITIFKENGIVEEVPVSMNERKGGKSSIYAWKCIYYMMKVSLAIIINSISFKRKGRK